MNLIIRTILSLTPLLFFVVTAHAASYPAQYKISDSGFYQSLSLQEKLSTNRGEVYFKDYGLYVGASDVAYPDRVVSDDFYEIDTYAGIKKKIGIFGYHVGVKSYNRALNKDLTFQEMYIGGMIQNLSFSYATNESGIYRQLNLFHDVLSVKVGMHVGETLTLFGQTFSDWSVYASRTYKKMNFNAIMTKSDNPLYNNTEFNLGVEKEFSLF